MFNKWQETTTIRTTSDAKNMGIPGLYHEQKKSNVHIWLGFYRSCSNAVIYLIVRRCSFSSKKRAFSGVTTSDNKQVTRLCHYQRSKRSAYNDSIYLLVFTKDDSKPDVVHPCYFGVIDPGLPWSSVDKFKVISLQKQHARDHTAGPWTTNRTQYGRCDICVRKCCRAKYLEIMF